MHLQDTEREVIKQATCRADTDAAVYQFGSCVDDPCKTGGYRPTGPLQKINLMSKLAILPQLHQKIGEQRIDLVVYPDLTKPFARLARQEGIPL
jgi:hypothetical protein